MSTVPSSGRPVAGQVRTAVLLDRRCPARAFPRGGTNLRSGKYETRFVNVKLIVPFSLFGPRRIGNFFCSRRLCVVRLRKRVPPGLPAGTKPTMAGRLNGWVETHQLKAQQKWGSSVGREHLCCAFFCLRPGGPKHWKVPQRKCGSLRSR